MRGGRRGGGSAERGLNPKWRATVDRSHKFIFFPSARLEFRPSRKTRCGARHVPHNARFSRISEMHLACLGVDSLRAGHSIYLITAPRWIIARFRARTRVSALKVARPFVSLSPFRCSPAIVAPSGYLTLCPFLLLLFFFFFKSNVTLSPI